MALKITHEIIVLPRHCGEKDEDSCYEEGCSVKARFCINRNGYHNDAYACEAHLSNMIIKREEGWPQA